MPKVQIHGEYQESDMIGWFDVMEREDNIWPDSVSEIHIHHDELCVFVKLVDGSSASFDSEGYGYASGNIEDEINIDDFMGGPIE